MDTLKYKIKLGRCYGRKPYEKLSTRQKRRIISRIENNISSEKTSAVNENTHQNVSGYQLIQNSFNNEMSLFENMVY